MITIRKSDDRGRASFGWLDSKHSFSFGHYYDPKHMGFGPLRVINEDRVRGGAGFDTHGHQNMEIISYVLDGAIEHKDSIGTGSVIRPGEIQRMSAGSGIRHSEYNHSEDAPVHFLQIWILPDAQGMEPSYEQKTIRTENARGKLALIGSPAGGDGAVTIHQDVALYLARLGDGERVEHRIADGRLAWVQVTRGSVTVNGQALSAGDGAAISDESEVSLVGAGDAEVLLFDMVR